ncbi:hypothetical protein [Companilactobacillus baiquanensis]|uniref:Uncharacterized protein n=1 Tax=Companilactobacillus baiquanensis TaxID=2486005 RepID=A0ABW1UR67_9LACO|nr:hypothetical protein [Companilactobacillus baiquanensis]
MEKVNKPAKSYQWLFIASIVTGGIYLLVKLYQEIHCLLSNKCDM